MSCQTMVVNTTSHDAAKKASNNVRTLIVFVYIESALNACECALMQRHELEIETKAYSYNVL